MKNITILALILAIVAPVAFIFNSAASASSCVEQLIYAQDYDYATYALGDDTAIIRNRNGATLAYLGQRKDDYVIWPSTYKVDVKKGDVLNYTGVGRHRLIFDVLDDNANLIEKVDSAGRGGSFSININKDGFIRFNLGEIAIEYNKLTFLCVPNTNTNSNTPSDNNPPVWSQVSNQNAYVGQNLQFSVHATDPDGDSITYSALYLPSGASFNSSSRVFNWTPSNNQIGTYQVVFRASDGSEYADMTVTIHINSNNNNNPYNNLPPVWSFVPTQYVNVNQILQLTVQANDPEGAYLTYSAFNLPSGSSFDNYSRRFTWTPTSGQIGTYYVTLRASDSYNSSDTQLTIIVSGGVTVSQMPIFIDFNPPLTAREGQVYTATIRATSGNLPITYRIISGPSGMIINEKLGVIIWVPNFSQGGSTYTVNVGASNGTLEATRVFYVTVEDMNYIVPASVAPPAPQPPVYVAPKPAPEAPLKIFDIAVDKQESEDVVVLFKTNHPSSGEIMYDLISQADKTKNFSYTYNAVGNGGQTTNHSVNLGNLDGNRSYYLRAVAKRGNQTAVSQEIALIQVNKATNYMAFLIGFFNWLISPWLLWLIVIILLILLLLSYRRQNKILIDNRQYHRPASPLTHQGGPFGPNPDNIIQ